MEKAADSNVEASAESEEALVMPKGILCLGDEFMSRQDVETKSFPAVIQGYLSERSYSLKVDN